MASPIDFATHRGAAAVQQAERLTLEQLMIASGPMRWLTTKWTLHRRTCSFCLPPKETTDLLKQAQPGQKNWMKQLVSGTRWPTRCPDSSQHQRADGVCNARISGCFGFGVALHMLKAGMYDNIIIGRR